MVNGMALAVCAERKFYAAQRGFYRHGLLDLGTVVNTLCLRSSRPLGSHFLGIALMAELFIAFPKADHRLPSGVGFPSALTA